jgi:hypothetical protein
MVECSFRMSFDINNPPNGNSISCSDFTCKYDGSEIDCEDLQEDYSNCS